MAAQSASCLVGKVLQERRVHRALSRHADSRRRPAAETLAYPVVSQNSIERNGFPRVRVRGRRFSMETSRGRTQGVPWLKPQPSDQLNSSLSSLGTIWEQTRPNTRESGGVGLIRKQGETTR